MTPPPLIDVSAIVKHHYDQGFRYGFVWGALLAFGICVMVFT